MDLWEETLTSELKFDGKVVKMRRDTVKLPDGSTSFREVVEHPGGVGVVAVTDDKKVLMVRQFRAGPQKVLLEIPAGKLEMGEDPAECGRRELSEETGYTCMHFSLLSAFYSSPGYCEEKIYVYLAEGLMPGEGHLDSGEFLNVEQYDFDQLHKMLKSGEICDAKTVIGILLAEQTLK